ncbi:MAG: hypothetical protein ABI681_06225 [Gemmatimonadales bacterium]
MTAASLRHDPGNALTALGDRARSMSSANLVALELAGLAIALALYMWLPRRLAFALPFLALSAFGLWGVVEHVVEERGRRMHRRARLLLRLFQLVFAVAGVVAAAATGYLIVGRLIGTVVS